jgi:hypothetical protein
MSGNTTPSTCQQLDGERTNKPDPRFDTLQPGIPDYLTTPIWLWAEPMLTVYSPGSYIRRDPNESLLQMIQLQLRVSPPLEWAGGGHTALSSLEFRFRQNQELGLNLVDYLLRFRAEEDEANDAHAILTMGGSEWEVVKTDETFMLSRRLIGPIASVVDEIRPASERAHAHLVLSWQKLASRDPDAPGAYREAIKAVEAAAKPVISPQNHKATLGTIVADMRAKPEKWRFVLDHSDTERVTSMCEAVWKGQIDRHGTDDPNAPLHVGHAEADAAFHLALSLVRIFAGGLLGPVPKVR